MKVNAKIKVMKKVVVMILMIIDIKEIKINKKEKKKIKNEIIKIIGFKVLILKILVNLEHKEN